jgi:hypothetical protein
MNLEDFVFVHECLGMEWMREVKGLGLGRVGVRIGLVVRAQEYRIG